MKKKKKVRRKPAKLAPPKVIPEITLHDRLQELWLMIGALTRGLAHAEIGTGNVCGKPVVTIGTSMRSEANDLAILLVHLSDRYRRLHELAST